MPAVINPPTKRMPWSDFRHPFPGNILDDSKRLLDMQALCAYTIGMKSRHISQYTIRDVPPEMNGRLRDIARRWGCSLNQALLRVLARGADMVGGSTYRDLDDFFGSWVSDAEVDGALEEQRKIDPGLWR